MDWGKKITYLGSTTLKEKEVQFGIKDEDRLRHFCVLGRVGSGRSELITNMALQDIGRGIGTIILDTNGNAAPKLLERLSEKDKERLIFLNPAEAEHPYSWNIVEDVRSLSEEKQREAFSRILKSVYHIYNEPFTGILVPELLKRKDSTIVTFYSILTNKKFRENFFSSNKELLETLEDLIEENQDIISEIDENGRYVAKDTLIRNLLGQSESKFNLSDFKDGKLVVVDLSQIKMFPTRMTPIVRVFLEAADIGGKNNEIPVSVYMHDCLRYLGEKEIDWAFNSRNVTITVADTIVQEEDKERREIALSKCGSVASFASHHMDKSLMERAFYPYVSPEELNHLEDKELVVALTIDNVRSRPFFAKVLDMKPRVVNSIQDLMIESRNKYTTQRTKVDATFKAMREIDNDGPGGPPGGFQDAFKSIFAKRAQGGGNTPQNKKPQEVKENAKKEEKKEVPETTLKQMLYVNPVTS